MPSRSRIQPTPILKHEADAPAPASLPPAAPAPTADALPFSACTSSIHSTRVTFPPTPKLAAARMTYPPHAYDRTPIVVAPNECALPRRNAHSAQDARAPRAHFAPAAPTPGLTWSSSSSSSASESDDNAPADDGGGATPRFNALGLGLAAEPAFLPHPPSPERDKARRRSATPAARVRRALPASFALPNDDGCLGGF